MSDTQTHASHTAWAIIPIGPVCAGSAGSVSLPAIAATWWTKSGFLPLAAGATALAKVALASLRRVVATPATSTPYNTDGSPAVVT